jgi:hypothetical protein
MPTFEEVLRAARAARGVTVPDPIPVPDTRTTLEKHFARLTETPDYVVPPEVEAEQQPVIPAGSCVAGPIDPSKPTPWGPAAIPTFARSGPGEPYICHGCRTVRNFSDHDDAATIRRKCSGCHTAAMVAGTKAPHLSDWWRIRTAVEYRDGQPAGVWRPFQGPGGGWELSPDMAAQLAEVARRKATL